MGDGTLSLAVLAPCPVQYHAPFYRRLAALPEIDLSVLYVTDFGLPGATAKRSEFGHTFAWDIDLLSGYDHVILRSPGGADLDRPWTVTAPGLVSQLDHDRFDVLVNFGWRYPANLLAFLLARARRIPYLLYTDTDVRDSGRVRPLWLRRRMLQSICARAAGALFTGTFNRDFYIRHGLPPDRLWFSPWAVDNDRFAASDRQSARAALDLADDIVYFLSVGKLIPRKQPNLVLEAVRRLHEEGHQVGAIFAGSGELEVALRERARAATSADVRVLGFVNQLDLPRVYAAADVFVLPSLKDPRATVVNEAMASGLPPIVSEGTGVWGVGDLVRHGQEGYVVPVGGIEPLVDACRRLIDPSTRAAMAQASRSRVELWSYETAVDGWRAALATCLGASRAA